MRAVRCVITRLVVIIICLLLFAACRSDTKDENLRPTALSSAIPTDIPALPSAIPTRTPYLAPQPPTARYIMGVIPTSGSILNVQDFREGKHIDKEGDWLVVGPITQSICVELDAWWLLEPGDDFTSGDLLLERIEFIVDNQILSRPDGIGDFITLSWLLDEDGNKVAVAGGPYVFCWASDLDAGTHTAYLEVRKTSGQVLEYRWSFTLTDD